VFLNVYYFFNRLLTHLWIPRASPKLPSATLFCRRRIHYYTTHEHSTWIPMWSTATAAARRSTGAIRVTPTTASLGYYYRFPKQNNILYTSPTAPTSCSQAQR